MQQADWQNAILPLLPPRLAAALELSGLADTAEEIRIRANKPLQALGGAWERMFFEVLPTEKECQDIISAVAEHSIYAYEEEINQGFVTLKGGYRVGLCGRSLVDRGRVGGVNYFSSFNFRIRREVKGAADPVMPYLAGGGKIHSALLISPPGCGKTTLLRDIARQFSDGYAPEIRKVCIADERSEIAGCMHGLPQNDVGLRTDVFDGCPKAISIEMMLRTMAPDLIAMDELGSEDEKPLIAAANSGVTLIATAHGYGIEDMLARPLLKSIYGSAMFSRYVLLGRGQAPGEIRGIYDGELRKL